METNFSFKSLFAIWSIWPQWFHHYIYFSIFSWQYQKYWTILMLLLWLLCVTPLVCSSYSSCAPPSSSPFFGSWWQRNRQFTHKLVLRDSPSMSSCQPQTTHLHRCRRVSPRRTCWRYAYRRSRHWNACTYWIRLASKLYLLHISCSHPRARSQCINELCATNAVLVNLGKGRPNVISWK